MRFIAIVLCFLYLSACEPSKGAAIEKCKEHVKSYLKSPYSAKFDKKTMRAAKLVSSDKGVSRFMIGGNVDSQNGFGAMVRSYFWCEVRAITTKDNTKWETRDFGSDDPFEER